MKVYLVVEHLDLPNKQYTSFLSAYTSREEALKEVEMHKVKQRAYLIRKGYDPDDDTCTFVVRTCDLHETFDEYQPGHA